MVVAGWGGAGCGLCRRSHCGSDTGPHGRTWELCWGRRAGWAPPITNSELGPEVFRLKCTAIFAIIRQINGRLRGFKKWLRVSTGGWFSTAQVKKHRGEGLSLRYQGRSRRGLGHQGTWVANRLTETWKNSNRCRTQVYQCVCAHASVYPLASSVMSQVSTAAVILDQNDAETHQHSAQGEQCSGPRGLTPNWMDLETGRSGMWPGLAMVNEGKISGVGGGLETTVADVVKIFVFLFVLKSTSWR